MSTQPALFDFADVERHLVELAGPDRARFTGTTVAKDGELVDAVLAAVVQGVPRETIARLARISPTSIASIVDRAEKSGTIGGWKERMSRILARATETAAAGLVDDLEKGKLPAGQKPIAIGILVDKKLLLDGEATSRIEVERVRPEDILRRIKAARLVEIEGKGTTN